MTNEEIKEKGIVVKPQRSLEVEIKGAKVVTLKGEKGDKGDKGERGDITAEGVVMIRGKDGENGKDGERGEKGDKGDIGPKGDKGDKGERGEKGEKGDKGDKGESGKDGENGKDGSPDTIEQLIEKLNSTFNYLDFRTLKNIPDFVLQKDIISNQGGGGGNIISYTNSSGTVISQYVTTIQFGSGITPTYSNGVITITATSLPTFTANRVIITDGSGNLSASSVTATELGYLSGLTSNIQTQLDSKMSNPLIKPIVFQNFTFDTSQGGTAGYSVGTQGGTGQTGALIATTYTNAVGVFRLTSGTTSNTGLALQANPQQIGTFRPGTYAARFVGRSNMNQLSNATERYTIRIGLITGAYNADPTSGIYFRYTDNVNSGKYQCVCRNGGSETVINTSVTPAVSTNWDKLDWRINAAGTSVEFFINDVSQGTTTTNIPTTTYLLLWFVLHKVAGTSSQLMEIDLYYFDLEINI